MTKKDILNYLDEKLDEEHYDGFYFLGGFPTGQQILGNGAFNKADKAIFACEVMKQYMEV